MSALIVILGDVAGWTPLLRLASREMAISSSIFILRVSFAQLRQGQSEEGRCLGLAIQTASQRLPSFNSYEISGQVPNLRGTAHQDEQTSVSRPPLPNHPQVERASPRRLIQIGSYLLVSYRLLLMSS